MIYFTGTIILESFPLADGFTLLDTRGFDLLGGDAQKEILAILNGDIKDESGIDRGTYTLDTAFNVGGTMQATTKHGRKQINLL